MNLKNRIQKVEQHKSAKTIPPLEIISVSSREQAKHPERFKKVLDKNQPRQQPGSLPWKWYTLKEKNHESA